MAQARTRSGISLEYETYGDPADPPILMVMGFGAQLTGWPRGFCEHLAAGAAAAGPAAATGPAAAAGPAAATGTGGAPPAGRFVIAYDNRDTGLSQRFDGQLANTDAVLAAVTQGDFGQARALAPYTLDEMAADGLGLLTALGIDRAHVLGASMGGFIAQTMAISQPQRLLSLTSMMSSTGEPEYGQAAPDSLSALLEPAPSERAAYIESADRWLLWHSMRYPEAEQNRRLAAEAFDRGVYPEGTSRQLAVMLASSPRDDALRRIRLPTLVIHGSDDTLIAPNGGERTAELIPDAKLVLIADMGHDRPRPLWDQICEPIWELTAAAA